MNHSYPAPIIFTCQGETLNDEEKEFFQRYNPFGFILFRHNCRHKQQVQTLVRQLQACVHHHAAILIDQEGGRVQRLPSPPWPNFPAAAIFGRLAEKDMQRACQKCQENAEAIGKTLAALGINVNCAPVVDLPQTNADPVIGDRAFSREPETMIRLADAYITGLQRYQITPILKHIPGHGRALCDSHNDLPVIDTPLDQLKRHDFLPFYQLRSKKLWAMTAHIIYTALDASLPTTVSPIVLTRLIRTQLEFDQPLISDDITMGALKQPPALNARKALQAGCDLVLHSNGNLAEMQKIMEKLPPMTEKSWQRLQKTMPVATRT